MQFAAATDMIIGGTIFTHKNIHKVTWRSADRGTMNQIDHILIQKKHSFNLKDVRCKRGVNVYSDHYFVMSEIEARISANKTQSGKGSGNIICGLWKTKSYNRPSESRLCGLMKAPMLTKRVKRE